MSSPIKVLVVHGSAVGKLDLYELTEYIKPPHINARGTICFDERTSVPLLKSIYFRGGNVCFSAPRISCLTAFAYLPASEV